MLGGRLWLWHPNLLRAFSLAAFVLSAPQLQAQTDIENCRKLLKSGEYEKAVDAAQEEMRKRFADEEWSVLCLQAMMSLGRYAEAKAVLEEGLIQHSRGLRVRLIGHEVYLRNGEPQQARQMLEEIEYLFARSQRRYLDPEDMVALGRVALKLGSDPRLILEGFYDRAKQADPLCRSAYLATGELALNKHDDQVAATAFSQGIEKFPEDADMHFGLAEALSSSDSEKAHAALAKTLELNSRHVPAILFSADFLISSEQYDKAEEALAKALAINPRHHEAWAYRAVLAHLRGDYPHERACRAAALQSWPEDPSVDHLLGKKLSQKYRFEEGARFQWTALTFDPGYLPAKIQLSQDLLRLGREEEGWRLASESHEKDEYDVVTFNLMQLRDRIEAFRTLTDDDIILRMDPREAEIYGSQVMRLLLEAKEMLGKKYGFELKQPVTVEIFPQQSDFAVRTFGMPGGAGYLGVCFGHVITANSPASQRANPTNWKSVLWHEYCHVVTLQLTANKMPRWLSEGISVYEERQANPAWGQRMNPTYRKMILEGELTPVGRLSGAFLNPKSGQHLQFAYYESSLVVEYLIEKFGFENLKAILHDLGAGMPINAALERHTGLPISVLEEQFEKYAKARAESLAPDLDWTTDGLPTPPEATEEDLRKWLAEHPKSYGGLMALAKFLLASEQWEAAKEPLQKLLELYPNRAGSDSPLWLLATVYRKLGDTEAELSVLRRLAEIDDSAVNAYVRLLELDWDTKNWQQLRQNAERLLSVDPLRRDVQWYYGRAAEELEDPESAIAGYASLVALEPADPAEVHFRLARLLQHRDKDLAKRHVLLALEAAPRFRDAQALLLSLVDPTPDSN